MSLQDIYKNAGVVMKPAAMKSGKLYSQQPHSGAGDFNFSRADGVQTRINKHGLIETVANNEPRLSYDIVDGKVSDCPHLLLEPSRSNLFTYSEAINQGSWTKSNASIINDTTISPNGTQSAETFSITSNLGFFYKSPSLASGTTVTQSIFVKNIDADKINLQVRTSSTAGFVSFFFTNSEITNVELTSGISADFDNYGNGWYRVYLTCTTTETNQRFRFQLNQSGMSCYVWGAQLETGRYPTSYIPTSGSTETRQADACTGSGNSETFNSSEGVLYAELEALIDNDVSNRYISIANSAGTNFVTIQYRTSSSNLRIYQNGSGSSNLVFAQNPDLTDNLKIAVKYGVSLSDYAVYVNGVKKTINSGFVAGTMSGLSELKFLYGSGGAPWYGKAKELTAINEALTDEQLQLLTTP